MNILISTTVMTTTRSTIDKYHYTRAVPGWGEWGLDITADPTPWNGNSALKHPVAAWQWAQDAFGDPCCANVSADVSGIRSPSPELTHPVLADMSGIHPLSPELTPCARRRVRHPTTLPRTHLPRSRRRVRYPPSLPDLT